jgi:hypothetical protein
MIFLQEIANAESGQTSENKDRYQDRTEHLVIHDPEKQSRHGDANRENDIAWRERKHQRFHAPPPPAAFFPSNAI